MRPPIKLASDGCSFRINQANSVAPIGSAMIATETKVARTLPKAHVIEEWPINCGIIANVTMNIIDLLSKLHKGWSAITDITKSITEADKNTKLV